MTGDFPPLRIYQSRFFSLSFSSRPTFYFCHCRWLKQIVIIYKYLFIQSIRPVAGILGRIGLTLRRVFNDFVIICVKMLRKQHHQTVRPSLSQITHVFVYQIPNLNIDFICYYTVCHCTFYTHINKSSSIE